MREEASSSRHRLFWLIPFQAGLGLLWVTLAILMHHTLGRTADSIRSAGGSPAHIETSQGVCDANIGVGLFMIVSSVLFWKRIQKLEQNGVSNNVSEDIDANAPNPQH